jgi:hypothetical protein
MCFLCGRNEILKWYVDEFQAVRSSSECGSVNKEGCGVAGNRKGAPRKLLRHKLQHSTTLLKFSCQRSVLFIVGLPRSTWVTAGTAYYPLLVPDLPGVS